MAVLELSMVKYLAKIDASLAVKRGGPVAGMNLSLRVWCRPYEIAASAPAKTGYEVNCFCV
ncbi:hypothetical protein, partial [Sinomicrobium pectinilyticum]|uniref:hypothetical protein n=1 Tax=Sinomicrobium pectinilyticum TaxID=1084421 RepID=UPI0019D07F5D